MNESISLLSNYSKENHNNLLYSSINPIEFSIYTVKSENWYDANWLSQNKIPYIVLTHLLDSYDCLPSRPDMAFTFLWKSINNTYKKIGTINRIVSSDTKKLTDSDGLNFLINEIDFKKNIYLKPNLSILDLINEYVKIIPIKPLKFVSNMVLKGNSMENSGIMPLLIGSSYFTFKKRHNEIFNNIALTYCASYNLITTPLIVGDEVDLSITNLEKSKSIPNSLAEKLRQLLINKTETLSDSTNSNNYSISFENDKEYIAFLLQTILYSIRNNSVHGNVVSRLNSEFASDDSLKTAIYIYFLGHLFLTLGLFINNDLTLNDLNVNIQNLELLKSIL